MDALGSVRARLRYRTAELPRAARDLASSSLVGGKRAAILFSAMDRRDWSISVAAVKHSSRQSRTVFEAFSRIAN
jgi:hypothetical protein